MTTATINAIEQAQASRDNVSISKQISLVGNLALRYSIVVVLAWIGAMKFTSYEAGAIEGLVASSPLLAWMYSVFTVQGVANLIGVIEIATAAAILLGPLSRKIAIAGALGAITTFSITLTFLFSAPGWEQSLGGFPALSVVPGQFLLKDVVLLAASVSLLGSAIDDRT